MIDYGKLDFAVSFKPLTAFPLDSRSYFDSYSAAELAANAAVEAGSSDGTYYFGQTISVVENGVASFYIIQPDKTLQPVTGKDDGPVKVAVDEKQFAYTEDNKLVLKDLFTATTGQMLVVGEDGGIAWATPIDAYTKAETDSAIDAKVAAAAHLKREIVSNKESIDVNAANALTTIFMVANGLTLDDDRYDEYMVIETEIDGETVRKIEKVGSWQVDLSDYVKRADLENYVPKNGTDRLVTETEVEKWNKGEANVIVSASADFTIDENRQLNLNNISMTKVIDLTDTLNGKVDKNDNSGILVSATDREKLNALAVGEDGSVGVSGTINASNVKELDQWVINNRNKVEGLFNDDAKAKLEALFDQVNTSEFEIATIGDDESGQKKQLNLVAIGQEKVTGLSDTLNNLATKTQVTELEATLNAKFADYVLKTDYDSDIGEIRDALTWKELN